MNATQIEQYGLSYLGKPPILIGASSDAAMARAIRTVEAAGCRIGDTMTLESVRGRIQRQVAASAIWLELDDDGGAQMDDVLECVGANAADGRFSAVVSTTAELIDPVLARIHDPDIDVIVDADEIARTAALALALSRAGFEERLCDVAADQNAARLRQLSDEVSRIAESLARLSVGPAAVAQPPQPANVSGEAPELSAETVRSVIRARRLRSRYFSEDLFADPAWDMLLDLLQAEIAQLRVPVSSLCIAAAVPATTALRWLKTMVSQGLFLRRADPHDGRRVFVELAPEASNALRRYFADVGAPAVV